jgi:hypothetical protein
LPCAVDVHLSHTLQKLASTMLRESATKYVTLRKAGEPGLLAYAWGAEELPFTTSRP